MNQESELSSQPEMKREKSKDIQSLVDYWGDRNVKIYQVQEKLGQKIKMSLLPDLAEKVALFSLESMLVGLSIFKIRRSDGENVMQRIKLTDDRVLEEVGNKGDLVRNRFEAALKEFTKAKDNFKSRRNRYGNKILQYIRAEEAEKYPDKLLLLRDNKTCEEEDEGEEQNPEQKEEEEVFVEKTEQETRDEKEKTEEEAKEGELGEEGKLVLDYEEPYREQGGQQAVETQPKAKERKKFAVTEEEETSRRNELIRYLIDTIEWVLKIQDCVTVAGFKSVIWIDMSIPSRGNRKEEPKVSKKWNEVQRTWREKPKTYQFHANYWLKKRHYGVAKAMGEVEAEAGQLELSKNLKEKQKTESIPPPASMAKKTGTGGKRKATEQKKRKIEKDPPKKAGVKMSSRKSEENEVVVLDEDIQMPEQKRQRRKSPRKRDNKNERREEKEVKLAITTSVSSGTDESSNGSVMSKKVKQESAGHAQFGRDINKERAAEEEAQKKKKNQTVIKTYGSVAVIGNPFVMNEEKWRKIFKKTEKDSLPNSITAESFVKATAAVAKTVAKNDTCMKEVIKDEKEHRGAMYEDTVIALRVLEHVMKSTPDKLPQGVGHETGSVPLME